MATKIYLPSSGAAAVTPSTWLFANQINPLTFAGITAKISSTLTTKLEATGTTNPTTRAMLRYVWGPLAAQTISGTVRMVMRAMESTAAANANLAIAVKIIQPNGADRATLLEVISSDAASSPYEITTTLASKRVWTAAEAEPLTLTSQDATAGDYLVVEIGFRSATGTTRNISLRYGDAASSDLTYGDDETNDYNAWVEFSQTINLSNSNVNETATAARSAGVAAGSQTNEQDTLTLSRSAGITTVEEKQGTLESVTLSRSAGIAAADQVTVRDAISLSRSAGQGGVELANVSDAVSVGRGDAVIASSQSNEKDAVTLARWAGIAAVDEKQGTLESVTLSRSAGITVGEIKVCSETVTLSRSAGMSAGSQVSVQDGATLSRYAGIMPSSQINIRDAVTLARWDGIAAGTQASIGEVVSLAWVGGQGVVGQATISDSVLLASWEGMSASGYEGSEIEEIISLGRLTGMAVVAGGDSYLSGYRDHGDIHTHEAIGAGLLRDRNDIHVHEAIGAGLLRDRNDIHVHEAVGAGLLRDHEDIEEES